MARPGACQYGKEVPIQLNPNDFVIGINCDVVDDALKVHLEIKNGLVVREVYDDSSADEAGVQQHDILIEANGQELGELDDLIKVIQESGKEEIKVKLSLVRKGDEVEVSVTPKKAR